MNRSRQQRRHHPRVAGVVDDAGREGARVVAHESLLREIRTWQHGRYRGAPVTIHCHDHDAVLYRDIADLALALAGNRRRTWVDRHGRELAGAGVVRAAGRILREVLWSAPGAIRRHRRIVREVGAPAAPPAVGSHPHRVLYIRSDPFFGIEAGGSVGHIAGVVGGLRRDGHRVEVVSSDVLPGVPADEHFREITPVYEPIRNIPDLAWLEYHDQLLGAITANWERWRPDLVYHRYTLFSHVGLRLRARFRVPYICEYNGSLVWIARHWDGRRLLLERLADRIEALNLRQADLVVVVSDPLRDDAVRRGADPARVLVNPNGVDADRYSPAVSGADVRGRYGLEGRLVVGFIGTFGPWHGAEQLVEAAARLGDGSRDVRFLLIGDGVRMPEVRRRIAESGLGERVILTGLVPQEEGPAHLAACDILASPHVPNPDGSPFFGSPTKLFEYMAMGRPIVASALGQIAEVIEHGRTGWLVPPGDAEALARAIESMARDAELRSRLGQAARREAELRYTWDAHVRRILGALRNLRTRAAAPPEIAPDRRHAIG